MPGLIYGTRNGGRPVIDCELYRPTVDGDEIEPSTRNRPLRALLDTGATHVVATAAVIAEVGLIQGGTLENYTVGCSARTCRWFSADVVLRGTRYQPPHLDYTYRVRGAQVVEDALSGFDMILGWDAMFALGLQFEPDNSFVLRLP